MVGKMFETSKMRKGLKRVKTRKTKPTF